MNLLPDWMYHTIEESSTCQFASTTTRDIPVVLPVLLAFDRDKRCFTLSIPQQRPVPASVEQVALTLLHYDEQTKGERYVLFYGHLTGAGEKWTFTLSDVVIRR